MRASFVETMQGELFRGAPAALSFSVVAEAGSWRELLTTGATRLRGVVRAPPWADAAECQGTLRIGLRRLCYSLRFVADDGAPLTLLGTKQPRLSAPLRSMTVMRTELVDAGGTPLATGTLRFALTDLVPFLLSALPWPKPAERRLDRERRRVARRALEAG